MQFLKPSDPGSQRQESASRISQLERLIGPVLLPKAGLIDTINADLSGLRLVSNTEAEQFLNGRRPNGVSGKVRTGTLVIFEESGKRFRDKVEFAIGIVDPETIIFDVPFQFRGETGCLVCDHLDVRFASVSKKRWLLAVQDSRLFHLKSFPCYEGSFLTDPVFGLPIGDRIRNGNDKTRYLTLRPSSFIGLIAREFGNPKHLFTTDHAEDKMFAIAKSMIDIRYYAEQVVSLMKYRTDAQVRRFIVDWANEDLHLRKKLTDSGIALAV